MEILVHNEFDEIVWETVYAALYEAPNIFIFWSHKQVMDIIGINLNQFRYKDKVHYNPKYPSCGQEIKSCEHVLFCSKLGRLDVLFQSTDLGDGWMKNRGQHFSMQNHSQVPQMG